MEHKITNVIKLDSGDLGKDYTLGGVLFMLFLLPKANSGITLGSATTAGAMLARTDDYVEIPIITGQWCPVLVKALRGAFTAYTYGSAVDTGKLYSNSGSHYIGKKDVATYDNTATYAVGAYAISSSTVYRCTTAVETAEAFDSTKWTAISTISDMKNEGILEGTTDVGSISLTDYDVYIAPIED